MDMHLSLLCFLLAMSVVTIQANNNQEQSLIPLSCLRQEMMSEIEQLKEQLRDLTQQLNSTILQLTKKINEESKERQKLANELHKCTMTNSSQNDVDDCSNIPCLNGGTCTGEVNSYTCSCPTGFTGQICETAIHFRDCAEIHRSGQSTSGPYMIYPVDHNNDELEVTAYCSAGWTVFQRRQNGLVPFNRTWEQYKKGFGSVHGEYWLGNKFISAMTFSAQRKYRLRIELTRFNGETRYAEYTNFRVGPESSNFTLSIGTYSGTAGSRGSSIYSGLLYHNGMQFSTFDVDNDKSIGSCSRSLGSGGFWFNDCYGTNLNGQYYSTESSSQSGIHWLAWNSYQSLKKTRMMCRPMNFP